MRLKIAVSVVRSRPWAPFRKTAEKPPSVTREREEQSAWFPDGFRRFLYSSNFGLIFLAVQFVEMEGAAASPPKGVRYASLFACNYLANAIDTMCGGVIA